MSQTPPGPLGGHVPPIVYELATRTAATDSPVLLRHTRSIRERPPLVSVETRVQPVSA